MRTIPPRRLRDPRLPSRAGELATTADDAADSFLEAVHEYNQLLQTFLDETLRRGSSAAPSEWGAPVPVVFNNAEPKGSPSEAEVMLFSLLLLSALTPRDLCRWVEQTLEQQAEFERRGEEWCAPNGTWAPTVAITDILSNRSAATIAACAHVIHQEGLVAGMCVLSKSAACGPGSVGSWGITQGQTSRVATRVGDELGAVHRSRFPECPPLPAHDVSPLPNQCDCSARASVPR